MNSQQNGPSQILIWSSTNHRFELIYPNTSTITCIAFIQSHREEHPQRCTNKITQCYIEIAQSISRKLLQPRFPTHRMFFRLADATLCRQSHQDQAAELAQIWTALFEPCLPYVWCPHSGAQIHCDFTDGSDFDERHVEEDSHASEGSRGDRSDREHRQQPESWKLREMQLLRQLCEARREAEEIAQYAQSFWEAGYQWGREMPEAAQSEDEKERQHGQQQRGEEYRPKTKVISRGYSNVEEVYRCAVQDRANSRDRLRADQRARLAREDSARVAEAARSRLEAEVRRAFDQVNRDEAKKQAEREKAGILAARAAAKREREQEEQNAKEKQRQDRERAERARQEEEKTQREAEDRHLNEARQRREDNARQPWSTAWEV
jgi:hypothetical protein